MKCLKTFRPALAAILASGAAGIANAQMPAGGPPGWNAAMSKLFGDIKAFSAKPEMRALDKSGQPAIQVPMSFALLDNKVRMDIDMTQVHLSKPDAKQFDAPAGCTKHTDMQQLMMAIAQKQNQKGGKE